MRHWTAVLCAFGLAAALVWAGAPPVTAQGAGSIVGEVKFSGTPPAAKNLKVDKDSEVCGSDKPSEELVVGASKGIKNAVVSLAGAKGPAPKPAQKPALDQKKCHFAPHVLVVPAGAEVDILNSDGILHNLHTFSAANSAINKAQPKFKKVMTEKFDKPEVIKVQCDVHSWMSAWIVVADHPYYSVTDEGGTFKLDNVPPGKHKVEVWHESLGKLSREVEVKAGAPTKVTFELSKK
ncbi:MAG: carboxypeptidase regulatory-like domain-containing protein [Candidatus Rokubacteria bacterium]|nr:carboxypeptidase regulatory-like domain-containing protein [Candidatus Rokubacteria bacterium]